MIDMAILYFLDAHDNVAIALDYKRDSGRRRKKKMNTEEVDMEYQLWR